MDTKNDAPDVGLEWSGATGLVSDGTATSITHHDADVNSADVLRFQQTFRGREDDYGEQRPDGSYSRVGRPLGLEDLQAHLDGEKTVGVYLLDPDASTCWHTVLDFDTRNGNLDTLRDPLQRVQCAIQSLGIGLEEYVVEFTGNRGHHLWFVYARPVAAVDARRLGHVVLALADLKLPDGITIETFPKQAAVAEGGFGNLVKLPLGLHRKSGKFSQILSPPAWDDVGRITPERLQRIISDHADLPRDTQAKLGAPPIGDRIPHHYRNETLTSLAGSMRRRGASEEAILAALLTENRQKCDPPLEDSEVHRIAASIAKYAPEEPAFPLTDLGNAERLIAAHGDDLRFNVDAGCWLVWDGRRWKPDTTGEVHRLATEVVRGMYDLLKDARSADERDALYRHIRASESASRLAAMVDLARRHVSDRIPVQAADLDTDPWLLNVENGTLNLRTGKLRPHRRDDLLTKLAPVSYNPAADCPRWTRFLVEVFGDDEELIGFVRRMCGYLLTGDTREDSFFILQGKGSNGKGVLTRVLSSILGDYARDTPVTTFLEHRDTNTSDLASLVGARMVTASEGEDTRSFNESLLKRLTGQDPITCRHLYQGWFTYTPTFKVLFATNEVPRIKSQNYSMRRRVKLLPFRTRFYYPHERKSPVRDEQLLGKLLAEREGILAWMVEGCRLWQSEGLGMPPDMAEEVDSLFVSMDPLADFLDSECELHPGAEVETGALWRAYQRWCEAEQQRPVFKRVNEFARNLCGRDGIEARRTKPARLLSGIRLLEPSEEPSSLEFAEG